MREGIKSFGWNGVSQAYRIIFSSIVLIFLAMLVSVEDFGIIGMSTVFVVFFNMLLNIGLDTSLIYSKTTKEEHLFTLFLFSIIIGFFLSVLGYFVSPLIGLFYENEETGAVFGVLTSSVFFSSIGLIPKGYLHKKLEFKKVAIIDFISITISGTFAIVIAFNGYGYWALVLQQLLTVLLSSIGYIYLVNNSIFSKCTFFIDVIKEHLKFGYNVLIFNTVNFFAQQLDVLLIGKFLGELEVGIYTLAFNLVVKPINLLIQAFNKTIFPFLSKVEFDKIPKLYTSYTNLFFYFFAPLVVFAVSISQILIPVFLTEKWILTLPLLLVFGYQAIRGLVGSPSGMLFLISGKPQKQWKFSLLVSLPLRILGIVFGFFVINNSALGISIGFNISATIEMFVGFWITFKLVNLKMRNYFRSFSSILTGLTILSILLICQFFIIKNKIGSLILQFAIFVTFIIINYYYNNNLKTLILLIKGKQSDEE